MSNTPDQHTDSQESHGNNAGTTARQIKGGISNRIGRIVFGKTQFDEEGKLRGDRKNFIRALLSSYVPAFGIIPLLWFKGEVNREAADRARKVRNVNDFVDDLEADRKSIEAALLNFMLLNPAITFVLSKIMFGGILENDPSTIAATVTTLVNFGQAYLVLRLARDDHRATAESGGQRLKDLPPDQGITHSIDH